MGRFLFSPPHAHRPGLASPLAHVPHPHYMHAFIGRQALQRCFPLPQALSHLSHVANLPVNRPAHAKLM